jgi:hypothetical protein
MDPLKTAEGTGGAPTCLYYFSFIPPGQGTSRNENLHKLLRRFLSGRPTISPQTFIALITTYVVHYNLRRQKKLQKNGQVWESSVQSDIHELFAQQIVEPFAVTCLADGRKKQQDQQASRCPYRAFGRHLRVQ